MKRALILLTSLAFTAGCERRDRFEAPDSSIPATPPVPQRAAFLSVSDLSPEAGGVIVVTGTLRIADDLSLGSYRVRLGFDSTKLQFVDEIPSPDMMRVVNPRAGDVIVVGASSNGSADGRLFALRLRVVDPAGLSSLVLRIDELNDTAFRDQKTTVTRASALVLDRSLAALATPSQGPSSAQSPAVSGQQPGTVPSNPVIDSISPRSGRLENERVTDIAIYGRGFAARGNLVLFGTTGIPGLMSESGGTIIRFLAPSIRVDAPRVAIRVRHDGMESNAVTFAVRDDRR